MPTEEPMNIELIQRALGVLRSRRLKRFKGTDIKVIERKVADYYASHSGESYYARLAEQKLWEDMIRHRDFGPCCQAAQTILDFGCGAGGLSVSLSQHYPDKKIQAIDIGAHAAALIAASRAKVDFRQGSVLEAPIPDASVDLLISRFVIEHTTRPEKLLSEAHRVLKLNGVIYLLYPQLLLKVTLGTALLEALSWLLTPNRLTYLDPQISDTTSDADDQDAVWLTNPVKIKRLLRRNGFTVLCSVPTQSLMIARKS